MVLGKEVWLGNEVWLGAIPMEDMAWCCNPTSNPLMSIRRVRTSP